MAGEARKAATRRVAPEEEAVVADADPAAEVAVGSRSRQNRTVSPAAR